MTRKISALAGVLALTSSLGLVLAPASAAPGEILRYEGTGTDRAGGTCELSMTGLYWTGVGENKVYRFSVDANCADFPQEDRTASPDDTEFDCFGIGSVTNGFRGITNNYNDQLPITAIDENKCPHAWSTGGVDPELADKDPLLAPHRALEGRYDPNVVGASPTTISWGKNVPDAATDVCHAGPPGACDEATTVDGAATIVG